MKTTVSFLGLMMVMAVFPNPQIDAGTYCDDSIFLRAGSRGVVSCDFGDFDVAGWLYSTDDLEISAPFISWDISEIHQESDNEEYSILPNGSLVIENVTVSHEKNYTARVYKHQELFHEEVSVKVYVLPDPEHPVLNGHNDQDHVVVHSSNGGASFNCTMDHIRPAVPLEVVFVSNTLNSITKKTIQSKLNNSDGTHNVSLHVDLQIGITEPTGVYSVQCKVAGYFAQLFPAVVTVDLVHDKHCRYKFPSVNGLDSQQHVVLDVDREGVLNCSMDRLPPDLVMEWELIQHDSPAEIAIDRQGQDSFDNGDGTNNIMLISSYRTTSNSVQRLVLKCMLSGKDADLYPLYTTVELNFPATDSDTFSCNTSLVKKLLVFSAITVTVACILYFLALKIRRMSNKDPPPQVPLQEREGMLQQTPNGNTHQVHRTL